MVHASEAAAKVIARALSRNLKRLDALGWQLREEEEAWRILNGEQLKEVGRKTGLLNAEHADFAE